MGNMHFKLIVCSFLCVLVITTQSSSAKTVIDLTRFNIPNFSQFLSVNFCKPGLKMFRSYIACNGRIDCPDGSDETSQLCQDSKCSNSLFRCNYGACIGRNFVCNGAFDCADGSDEQPDLCSNAKCRVPFATSSTVYYAGDCEGQCGGFLAEDGTTLHYLCANNSSDTNFLTVKSMCRNGFWRPSVPSCTGGNITLSAQPNKQDADKPVVQTMETFPKTILGNKDLEPVKQPGKEETDKQNADMQPGKPSGKEETDKQEANMQPGKPAA